MGRYVIEYGDVWFEQANSRKPEAIRKKVHVCDGTADLAIAMSGDVMMKSGSAESIENWVALRAAGLDITVIRFPVSEETVAELNACLENSTRAAHILGNLDKIGKTNPTLATRTKYPK